MKTAIKKIAYFIWHLRGRIHLDLPLPCLLPFSCWFLAYGDGMGFMFFFKRPYEENEWRFMYKFLKPSMTFLDVGANQGFHTLLAARQVGASGKVFSFEPVPSQNAKLKRNIKLNRFYNVITNQLALGAENKVVNMYVCMNGDQALSSLRKPSGDVISPQKIIHVSLTTIDKYVQENNIRSIDFIKIDVEGGELDVLKGSIKVLENFRPILMCEVQDKRTLQWGYKADEICKFVKAYGYSWFSVVEKGLLKPAGNRGKHDLAGENLIALPAEKVNKLYSFLR